MDKRKALNIGAAGVLLPLIHAACGLLVAPLAPAELPPAAVGPDGGLATAGALDGGPIDPGPTDSGPGTPALPSDAGLTDAGLPDGGPVDAGLADASILTPAGDGGGRPDAGLSPDAGAPLDAGHLYDGGPPPDAAAQDAGPVPPPLAVRLLAQGASVGSVALGIAPAVLADIDVILVYVAREQTSPLLDLPGNWSGATWADTSSGDTRIVGTTRYFQEAPRNLPTTFSIDVAADENFSFALVGVQGYVRPDGRYDRNTSANSSEACPDAFAVEDSHSSTNLDWVVTGIAHRSTLLEPLAGVTVLTNIDAPAGPDLQIQVQQRTQDVVRMGSCVVEDKNVVMTTNTFELP